jgi:hypothetical protein
MRLSTVIPLGRRRLESLVVDPRESMLYIADHTNNAVAIVDLDMEAQVGSIPVPRPRDLVLSRRSHRLYVSCDQRIMAIDPVKSRVLGEIPVESSSHHNYGIALSQDERLIGVATIDWSTLEGVLNLVEANAFEGSTDHLRAEPVRVVSKLNHGAPTDLVFMENELVALIDSFYLYQVDRNNRTQIQGGTIDIKDYIRDPIIMAWNHAMEYGERPEEIYFSRIVSGFALPRVYELTAAEPKTGNLRTLAQWTEQLPVIAALSPNEDEIYVVLKELPNDPRPETLAVFDVKSEQFTTNLYTFSNSEVSVRDIAMI